MLDDQYSADISLIGMQAHYRPPQPAIEAIARADTVFGSLRHRTILDQQNICYATWQNWKSPLSRSLATLAQQLQAKQKIAVIASGDPMHFGIGVTLAREFPHIPLTSWPAPSSFSLAANALSWALDDCICLSLHQHDSLEIVRYLDQPKRLLCLTKNHQTPREVAQILCTQGLGACHMTILADLASPKQHICSMTAEECQQQHPDFAHLHVLALDYRHSHTPPQQSLFNRDENFVHDGQITKFPFRVMTLAALCPRPRALLWDIGAGSGSISIGWNRLGGRSLSVEKNPQRAAFIQQNAHNILQTNLDIVTLDAVNALKTLESISPRPPEAIFFGGALQCISAYMPALAHGGVLVANAVTLQSQAHVINLQQQYGGTLQRLQIEEFAPIANHTALQPLRSLLQYRWHKT